MLRLLPGISSLLISTLPVHSPAFFPKSLPISHVLATSNTRKIGRGFGKDAGEWTGRVEISKEEIPDSERSMYGYVLIYSRL